MIGTRVVLAVILFVGLLLPERTLAEGTEAGRAHDVEGPVALMFAQSAGAMSFDGETLTLRDAAPATVFFSERPERLTGQLSNAAFVRLWNEGAESFKADPPNAALSLLDAGDQPPAVIEITGVSLAGGELTYRIRVLEGRLPASAGAVSLFIDPWVWVPPLRRRWARCYWSPYWHHRYCRHRFY